MHEDDDQETKTINCLLKRGSSSMAGHVAFGARSGGAPIILGCLLLVLAFGFSGSISTVFAIFSPAVLGVILFLTGAQLALGGWEFSKNKDERFITLVTAGVAIWNVGLAFLLGMVLGYLLKRGYLRL